VTDSGTDKATAPLGRDVLFVAGAGRSGTSAFAGMMQRIGMHVPEPEVPADATNPRGFGECTWVVDFHDRLLKAASVNVDDARPRAWELCDRAVGRTEAEGRISRWLLEQWTSHPQLLIKDPRLAWFLDYWSHAACRHGGAGRYAMMLRRPTEVAGSRAASYGQKRQIHQVASWLNMVLETEHRTRGRKRVLVKYDDLLVDPAATLERVRTTVGLEHLGERTVAESEQAVQMISTSLHRVRSSWDEVVVPSPLRELADDAWDLLAELAQPNEPPDSVMADLDACRERYVRMYSDAEALTMSTWAAIRRDDVARHPVSQLATRVGARGTRQLSELRGRFRSRKRGSVG
jgi:hypothetical protein